MHLEEIGREKLLICGETCSSEFGVDKKCINKLVVVRSASQMKRSAPLLSKFKIMGVLVEIILNLVIIIYLIICLVIYFEH